jgi:hypothetical protein
MKIEATDRPHAGRRAAWWGSATLVMIASIAAATPSLGARAADGPVISGTWTSTGSMAEARWHHTATLLPDGHLLVAGGDADCCATALASAELYDPAAGTWSPTGSMTIARTYQTATLLTDGEVLVAGGVGPARQSLRSAELYDPSTGTWSRTGPMAVPRYDQTATLLLDGTVLVTGGFDAATASSIASAELYHPETGRGRPSGAWRRHEAAPPRPCSVTERSSWSAASAVRRTTTSRVPRSTIPRRERGRRPRA